MNEGKLLALAGGVGDGWELLPEGAPVKEGDGFLHPDAGHLGWIDHVCRPDLFRGDRQHVHSGWPWRRKIAPTPSSTQQGEGK
jgi:hypothetical protein